jgi:transcriptional regulator with XRE-family HTH domain
VEFSPAVARRTVRLALRRAREARGLTQSQVAEAMEWSLSKVMRIESGEVTITPNDLRPLMSHLGITNRGEAEGLIQAAKASRQRQQWWDTTRFRENMTPALRQLIQYENEAKAFRYFYGLLVPGQLQTPDYARAILSGYEDLAGDVIETRLEARRRRHAHLLERADPPKIYLLLDESVLYRQIGGPEVLAEQLKELLRLVDEHRLLVRVVPFADQSAPIAMLGTYELLYLGDDTRRDAEENAIMYRESDLVDEIVEDADKLRRHRMIFERMWNGIPDEAASVEMLERHIKLLLPRGG